MTGHTEESVRARGPLLRRYWVYRAIAVPAEADRFNPSRDRLAENWFADLDEYHEALEAHRFLVPGPWTDWPAPLPGSVAGPQWLARIAGESKLDTQAAWDYVMLVLDKLIGHIIPVRFVAFSLVGGLGIGIHFAVLVLMLKVAGLEFVTGQSIATFVAMTSIYTLNNLLTYRDIRLRGWQWLRGWVSFTIVCSVGALANVGTAFYLFSMDTQWALAALAGILMGTVWNYAVSMYYT